MATTLTSSTTAATAAAMPSSVDLTTEQKHTIQSMAKVIGSLHKRQWIDDEKRHHYRNILKSMSTRETYNEDTMQRLKKKLDRLKQKHLIASKERSDEIIPPQTKRKEDVHEKALTDKTISNNMTISSLYTQKGDKGIGTHHISSELEKKRNEKQVALESGVQKNDLPRVALGMKSLNNVKASNDNDASYKENIVFPGSYSHQGTKNAHLKNKPMMRCEHPSEQPPFPLRSVVANRPNKNACHLPVQAMTQDLNKQATSSPCKNTMGRQSTLISTSTSTSASTCLSPSIVEPINIKGTLSHTQIQGLFVEMCAFARLQFVQPPSCIHCSYSKTVQSNQHNPKARMPSLQKDNSWPIHNCQNWVVWRKNANMKLHPQNMSHNILFVRCAAAQSLLKGETIMQWKWDVEQKMLVRDILYYEK